jgi:hypothetical protein
VVTFLGTTKTSRIPRTNFFPFTTSHLAKVCTSDNLRRGPFKAGIAELKKAKEESVKKAEVGKVEESDKRTGEAKQGLRKQKAENDRLFSQIMVQSIAKTSWSCRRCKFRTGYQYKARTHAVTCHKVVPQRRKRPKELYCRLCPHLPPFGSKALLRKHAVRRHRAGDHFLCPNHKMPISFTDRRNFFRHLRERHPTTKSSSEITRCRYCTGEGRKAGAGGRGGGGRGTQGSYKRKESYYRRQS